MWNILFKTGYSLLRGSHRTDQTEDGQGEWLRSLEAWKQWLFMVICREWGGTDWLSSSPRRAATGHVRESGGPRLLRAYWVQSPQASTADLSLTRPAALSSHSCWKHSRSNWWAISWDVRISVLLGGCFKSWKRDTWCTRIQRVAHWFLALRPQDDWFFNHSEHGFPVKWVVDNLFAMIDVSI